MVRETCVKRVPVTTCRMVTTVRQAGAGDHLPDGPEVRTCQVPVTTCRMVSETCVKQVPQTICETVCEQCVKNVPRDGLRDADDPVRQQVPLHRLPAGAGDARRSTAR